MTSNHFAFFFQYLPASSDGKLPLFSIRFYDPHVTVDIEGSERNRTHSN